MVRQGRFQTFLWELAVAILFFALAAAVTLQLFAEGSRQSEENSARNGAMLAAVSAAEQIAGADSPELSVLGGSLQADGSIRVFYDENWQPAGSDGVFQMTVTVSEEPTDAGTLVSYEICLERAEGETLYSLSTARYFPGEVQL